MEERENCERAKMPLVERVTQEIAARCAPEQIYLYNHRQALSGETVSFKLAVIGPFPDKERIEREIYLEIDSEVPFDVVLYTTEEWRELCESTRSFAHKIFMTGTVVYG